MMDRPRKASQLRVWGALLLCVQAQGCIQEITLNTGETVRGSTIGPAPLVLSRIDTSACTQPGCRDVCEDFTCCGTILDPAGSPFDPTVASELVVRERCCRSFEVTVTGRDELVGARWLPGTGANLEVIGDRSLPLKPDPGQPTVLRGCYRMPDDKADSCAADPGSATCETGLPPDDGILRYFFRQTPTVDVYVEVR